MEEELNGIGLQLPPQCPFPASLELVLLSQDDFSQSLSITPVLSCTTVLLQTGCRGFER